MKRDFIYILIILGLMGYALGLKKRTPNTVTVTQTDTVTVTDTIREITIHDTTIYEPKIIEKVKLDTVIILRELMVYSDTVDFSDRLKIHYQAKGYLEDINLGAIDTREEITHTQIITNTSVISKDGLYLGIQGYPDGVGFGGSYVKDKFMFSGYFGKHSNIGVAYKIW